MKFIALISGGKDSFFNIYHCLSQGHELIAIGNLYPPNNDKKDEIDSFMFQTVGYDIIDYYSQLLQVPLYKQPIIGGSSNQNLEYSYTENDEIEDLYKLISTIKSKHPNIEAVSCGAILSHYQRTRVENVCNRLNLTSLTYLWQRNQNDLMLEMCSSGIDARIIKVAAIGLNQKHLGKDLKEMYPHLVKLNEMYDVHICGEGGEFETIVLDCPFFKKQKLKIINQEIITHSNDVYYLKLKVEIVDKKKEEITKQLKLLEPPPLLDPDLLIIAQSESLHEDVSAQSKSNFTIDHIPKQNIKITPTKIFIYNLTSNDGATIEDQTKEIFQNLKTILLQYDLTFNDLQHVNVLLSDMSLFARMNKIYSNYFKNIYLPPSRICFETDISTTIQISCIVLKNIHPKTGIHIQSRSYWGPQNIGPYSQSIIDHQPKYKIASLSGQIPLIPSTMDISENNIAYNAALSLQHLSRVKNMVGVIKTASILCFITNSAYVLIIRECWNKFINVRCEPLSPYKENLIIAEVRALPRSSYVEWGGFSMEEINTVNYDDDEEDEVKVNGKVEEEEEVNTSGEIEVEENVNIDSWLSKFEYYSVSSKSNNSYKFITIFTSNSNLLKNFSKLISNSSLSIFITLLTTENIDGINAEYIPVRRLYNYEGNEFNYCIIIRQELS
ncbi:uncharacterized protein KGF55_001678 [Candida pseudojiufengensis]|uniref:uncharacterized protein n=1 Tax=Candida pseudojiufengensis TaxID=497109 RepID=UPI002225955F|nr:uncharacterized protein KGF55_001678 [Candida pseudojiufengensis]KAI5964609.1 hypothetical protein KGF55_001678 [Candida pseudojiufengensis]